jgi:hypothetical protein
MWYEFTLGGILMNKGFEVICSNCDEKTILTSMADNYMGFNGSDISSSNSKINVKNLKPRGTVIECKCGNSIAQF